MSSVTLTQVSNSVAELVELIKRITVEVDALALTDDEKKEAIETTKAFRDCYGEMESIFWNLSDKAHG